MYVPFFVRPSQEQHGKKTKNTHHHSPLIAEIPGHPWGLRRFHWRNDAGPTETGMTTPKLAVSSSGGLQQRGMRRPGTGEAAGAWLAKRAASVETAGRDPAVWPPGKDPLR